MTGNAVATTPTPAQDFRSKAAGLLVQAADMSLHQLVDEFLRLSEVMEANQADEDGLHRPKLNDIGELALRQRNLINGAARARFGLSFETWDRAVPFDGSF